MSILKTIDKKQIKFLMDYDYNNILGRLKYVLGKNAFFFADIRVKQNDVIWSTKDETEYVSYSDANDAEKQIIKEKFNEIIKKISSIISEDSLIGPHIDKIVSFPSDQYIFFSTKDGRYDLVLAGWGCNTTEQKENKNEKEDHKIDETDSNISNSISDSKEDNNSNTDNNKSEDKSSDIKENDIIQDNKKNVKETPGNNVDKNDKSLYTSEWLKKNTNIHGWLAFFLFVIALGGIVNAIYPIVTFNIEDYAGDMWLGAVDIIIGIELFFISLYTIYAFYKRKPNAVLYARLYIVIVFLINIISLIADFKNGISGISGIFWGIIWFLYLLFSEQVKQVIPKSFRKVNIIDWGVLGVIIMVPFICFAIGLYNIYIESENGDSIEISTYQLKNNERTDGRIIFKIPEGFECQSKDVEPIPDTNITIYSLRKDSVGSCTICSEFDSDTSTKKFDEYWNNWESEVDKKLPKTNIDRGSKTINGHYCMYRFIRYNVNGIYVYWRFHILFDEITGKCCVASFYDQNEYISYYIDEILESIRFQ